MSPRLDLGPKPVLGYTASRIERVAHLRGNAEALAALAGDTQASTYAMGGEFVALKKGEALHDPLFSLNEAQGLGAATETAFLGLMDGVGRFAVGLDAAAMESLRGRDDLEVTDLRSIAVRGLVAPDHLAPIAEGKALINWHARHRFCAHCGAATQVSDGGWRRDCANCKVQHFPRTDPVAIMLPVNGDRCVLGRSYRFIANSYSCLAGFIEPGETIEDAVRREVREEAGIVCERVSYFATQPWPFPTSLMIGCHAEALSEDVTIDREELEDARWFDRDEVAAMLLRKHPAGLITPPSIAIAYHIIRAWVEDGVAF